MDKKRLIILILFILAFIIAIALSALYYNDKYTVLFETGSEDVILTQYIKENDKVKEPINPSKEGFIFKEWQLNGETYNFEDSVKNNIILSAKWIKEEYIKISFNTNTSLNIKSRKVLKGECINNLPIPSQDNYEFIGWYINGNLYNNEEIHDDITLNAEYKNNTINTTYKIGDSVKIIGNYSSSAYSNNAIYSAAINWERKILNIIKDSNYPYVVGNETGVTGFFKANSIKKLDK